MVSDMRIKEGFWDEVRAGINQAKGRTNKDVTRREIANKHDKYKKVKEELQELGYKRSEISSIINSINLVPSVYGYISSDVIYDANYLALITSAVRQRILSANSRDFKLLMIGDFSYEELTYLIYALKIGLKLDELLDFNNKKKAKSKKEMLEIIHTYLERNPEMKTKSLFGGDTGYMDVGIFSELSALGYDLRLVRRILRSYKSINPSDFNEETITYLIFILAIDLESIRDGGIMYLEKVLHKFFSTYSKTNGKINTNQVLIEITEIFNEIFYYETEGDLKWTTREIKNLIPSYRKLISTPFIEMVEYLENRIEQKAEPIYRAEKERTETKVETV